MTAHQRLAPGRYQLRVEDYEMLAEAGAFGDARTELINGEVFVMSPQFLPHGLAKSELYEQLLDARRALRLPLQVLTEVSLEIAPSSMPAPDVMLAREPRGRKAAQPGTIPLVVEVADSSLAYDLGEKLALYARAGIPEYWVADLNGRLVHQMWRPNGDRYAARREVRFGERLVAVTLPGVEIDTDGL